MSPEHQELLRLFQDGCITQSAEETRVLAARFAALFPVDRVLALHGTLGVGKTTFVQGLAHGFGVTGHVTSPTFNIYSVHPGKVRQLVHLDAYRLEHGSQVEDLLLEEFLQSPWCLAVEWPSKAGAWLPADAWHLELSIIDGDKHRLRLIEKPSAT